MLTLNQKSQSEKGDKLSTENLLKTNSDSSKCDRTPNATDDNKPCCAEGEGEGEQRTEINKLHEISKDEIQPSNEINSNKLKDNNDQYLGNDLEKLRGNYTILQSEMNALKNQMLELTKDNNWLRSKLREKGLSDSCLYRKGSSETLPIQKHFYLTQGILQHHREDLDQIFQRLVINLTPSIAINFLPGLPAYIIFMCIRYTDLVNADEHVRDLLTKYVVLMKKAYRSQNTPEDKTLWLLNALHLYNLLKQYGGIDEYIKLNTEIQNQQQLKNFDLSEYRQVIYELITNLYTKLVQQVEELLKPYIVASVLDHVARARTISNRKYPFESGAAISSPIAGQGEKSLISRLDHFYKVFQHFGLPSIYIEQIFKQFFNYICGIAMNSLMLRGELCVWKTGMQIRYNISCIESWAKKNNLPNEVVSPLNPLMQVSSLLQARKNEEDVKNVYELCTSLTTAQVLKIIKSYNPGDYEESRISHTFIEKLATMLNSRETNKPDNDKFTVDENSIFPLKVVFQCNNTNFEEIELPRAWELDDLLTRL